MAIGEYRIGELMSDEDSLAHYGVKGMKWGRRGSKSETGVGRVRGARIDKNDRHEQLFKDLKSGLGQKSGGKVIGRGQKNLINGINRATMGKKLTEKYYGMQINRIASQTERLKSGKLKVRDRLALLNTTPASLLVSYRPKD